MDFPVTELPEQSGGNLVEEVGKQESLVETVSVHVEAAVGAVELLLHSNTQDIAIVNVNGKLKKPRMGDLLVLFDIHRNGDSYRFVQF